MLFPAIWRPLAAKLSIRSNVGENSQLQYEQSQSRYGNARFTQAFFDQSQSITRARPTFWHFDAYISDAGGLKPAPLIPSHLAKKTPPAGSRMQRLTNWLERRRSASRSRAAKCGQSDNNKKNNSNNKVTNDNNENKCASYLTGFRAGMTAAAAYASTRERKSSNFERGAPTYTSAKCVPFDRIHPSNCSDHNYMRRQLTSAELLSTSSTSSSLTTLSGSEHDSGGNGYWQPLAANTSHNHNQQRRFTATTPKAPTDRPNALRVDSSTPRRQIRTNPWLVNNNTFSSTGNNKTSENENKINASFYLQCHHSDVQHDAFERLTVSCTCASTLGSDDDTQRMARSTIYSDSAVSQLSVPSLKCTARKSDSSSTSMSFGDSGSQPTTFFSQLLHSSTCSSGYGSQDNSPECSVHLPDWTSEPTAAASSSSSSTSLRDIAVCQRHGADSGQGDVTVTLTGYASPFHVESQNSFMHGGSDEEEHIYHELESINRLSTHSDRTLMHDDAYDSFISLNSGLEEEPVYTVPFQRQRQRNDSGKLRTIWDTNKYFGSNYRTVSSTSSPLSESLDKQTQFIDNSSPRPPWQLVNTGNASDYDEIAISVERIGDRQADYDEEGDEDDGECGRSNGEEFSTASTSSASTSCSSWTPMLKTSGAYCDTEIQNYNDFRSLNSIYNCKSYMESKDDATTRNMLLSAGAVTRTRRLLPTVPCQPDLRRHGETKWRANDVKNACHKTGETNMLAKLDKQIIELQLQSDAVRGLVEEAKARNELRSRTRHLCMQHLRELRKLRCCVMHNHFELCI